MSPARAAGTVPVKTPPSPEARGTGCAANGPSTSTPLAFGAQTPKATPPSSRTVAPRPPPLGGVGRGGASTGATGSRRGRPRRIALAPASPGAASAWGRGDEASGAGVEEGGPSAGAPPPHASASESGAPTKARRARRRAGCIVTSDPSHGPPLAPSARGRSAASMRNSGKVPATDASRESRVTPRAASPRPSDRPPLRARRAGALRRRG